MALVVKSLPAKAGDLRDAGSTLRSGGAPGGGDVTHSSTLARRIPRTEESAGLWSIGSQELDLSTACTLVLKAEIANVPTATSYLCDVMVHSTSMLDGGLETHFRRPLNTVPHSKLIGSGE